MHFSLENVEKSENMSCEGIFVGAKWQKQPKMLDNYRKMSIMKCDYSLS